MSSVSNNNSTPFDALAKLVGSVTKEAGRAVGEFVDHKVEDINSIGKAIETGGFVGGFFQFLDVSSVGHNVAHLADAATGPGAMSPQMKEGISAFTNVIAGNPMAFKDILDMATAPTQPGVAPSAPNAVPAPNVEQLRGGGPHAPGGEGRTGYTDSPAPPRTPRDIGVSTEQAAIPLKDMLAAMELLKNSPECAERFPGIHAALNNESYSVSDQHAVIIATLIHDHPELLDGIEGADEARASIPRGEVPATPAPPASTGSGDFSQAGPQLQGLLGGALSMIGGLLGNPIVQSLLTPALTALCAAVPPLQVLVPFLPVILPLAGQALSGLGGMVSGGAGGAAGAPGGLGGDALGGMLSSLMGAFGGAGGLPAGAAPVFA
jgi:hypothetical protein